MFIGGPCLCWPSDATVLNVTLRMNSAMFSELWENWPHSRVSLAETSVGLQIMSDIHTRLVLEPQPVTAALVRT